MLNYRLTHPDLIASLAAAGHGSRILLADANYPVSSHRNPEADIIFLNLSPGKLPVMEILPILLDAIPVEKAAIMKPDGDVPDEVSQLMGQFKAALDPSPVNHLERLNFYNAVRHEDTHLVIATGETTPYGNLLLYVGVR